MNNSRRKAFISMGALACTAALSGCGGDVVFEPEPQTTKWSPIKLAVGSIDIIDNSPVSAETDFIGKRRTEALSAATKDYLARRFEPSGGWQQAQAVIEIANLVERPLDTTEGLGGLLKAEADAELEADLMVKIVILGEAGQNPVFSQARVNRSRRLDKNLSVVERDAIAKKLTGDVIDQLDRSLRQSVDLYLGEFITF